VADAAVDEAIPGEEVEAAGVVERAEEGEEARMQVGSGRRRRIFWTWGSIWTSGLWLSLPVVGKVCYFSSALERSMDVYEMKRSRFDGVLKKSR
jgi:hypothetical protein